VLNAFKKGEIMSLKTVPLVKRLPEIAGKKKLTTLNLLPPEQMTIIKDVVAEFITAAELLDNHPHGPRGAKNIEEVLNRFGNAYVAFEKLFKRDFETNQAVENEVLRHNVALSQLPLLRNNLRFVTPQAQDDAYRRALEVINRAARNGYEIRELSHFQIGIQKAAAIRARVNAMSNATSKAQTTIEQQLTPQ